MEAIVERGKTMKTTRSTQTRPRQAASGSFAVTLLASALALLAAVAPARAQTLDRIRSERKIAFGYRSDARPFSYRDEAGKPAGFSVALCSQIAGAIQAKAGSVKLETEFVPVDSAGQFDAVKTGTIDLLCGAATITLTRREEVSFSIPIFPSGIGALLRTDAPARMRDVLEGRPEPYRPRWRASLGQILEKRRFAVREGTTAQTWLADKLDEFNIIAETVPVDTYERGVADVVARRADVFFADRAILLDAAKHNASASDLAVLERQFTYEPLGLALARSDEDFRLLVDRVLSDAYRSGEVLNLYSTYFGEPDEKTIEFFRNNALPQ